MGDFIDIILAERFGGWPWEIDDVPYLTYLKYIRLLGVEGELSDYVSRLPTDSEVIFEDE